MGKHHRRSDSSESDKRHKKHKHHHRSPSYSSDSSEESRRYYKKRDVSAERNKKKHHKRSRSREKTQKREEKAPMTREEMIRIEQEKRRRGDRYSSSRSNSREKRHQKKISPKREAAAMPVKPIVQAPVLAKVEPQIMVGDQMNDSAFEKMFGFSDFSSTKGQNHQDDAEEAVFKQFLRQREYRQFMNKKPGVKGQPGQMGMMPGLPPGMSQGPNTSIGGPMQEFM